MGLEKLGKKLAQLGSDTKQGVQKMGESYQVNSRISDEKQALKRLYEVIGKTVYETYKEAPFEGLEDEFTAVRTALENIDKLNAQLNRLKGVLYCTECGKEASREECFCSRCGAKLPEAEDDMKEKMKKDMKEAAEEAGEVLDDVAGKAKGFMGSFAEKADAFMKGVNSKVKSAGTSGDATEAEGEIRSEEDAKATTPEDSVEAPAEETCAEAPAGEAGTGESPEVPTEEACAEESKEAPAEEAGTGESTQVPTEEACAQEGTEAPAEEACAEESAEAAGEEAPAGDKAAE